MVKKTIVLFLMISGLPVSVFPKEKGEKVSIGEKKVLHSEILNEDRNVHIFLPEGYSRSNEDYPVLFMLYSMAPDFHFYTGIVAGLSRIRLIPRMITVAFDLGDGKRDLTPTESPEYGPTSGGAGTFLQYLKDELIPFVEKNYRTGSQRLFWSHSIGGLFGLYALLEEPDVFQNVMVSSPFFIYDREEQYIIKNTKTFLNRRKGQKNFVYICVGGEPRLISEIKTFITILEDEKPEGLTWEYIEMPDENHMSILARSLIEGLRALPSE